MALSNPPSFTKILHDHNAPYLALPDDFVMKNMGDNIPEKVVIRSATGGYWWSVKVKKIDGRVSFDKGWTKVLKEARLCYEDTLFFWLVGETTFKMWIYGTNGCEKVLPPKVHVKVEEVVVLSDEDGGHVDGSDGDDGDGVHVDGSDGDDGDGVHVDGMNGDDGDGVHVDGMNGDEDGSEGGGDEDGSDSDYHYDGESEGEDAGSGADGSDTDHDAGSNGSDEGGAAGAGGGSGGGGAGSGGGSGGAGGADDAGSNGSGGDSDGDRYFTVTLSESHKRCLGLPSHFNGLPGIRHKEEIILKNLDGEEWEMGVTFRSNQYYLSRGWIAFTRDNKLEEGDECGFLFIKKEGKMCLTRVTKEHQNPPPRKPKVVV